MSAATREDYSGDDRVPEGIRLRRDPRRPKAFAACAPRTASTTTLSMVPSKGGKIAEGERLFSIAFGGATSVDMPRPVSQPANLYAYTRSYGPRSCPRPRAREVGFEGVSMMKLSDGKIADSQFANVGPACVALGASQPNARTRSSPRKHAPREAAGISSASRLTITRATPAHSLWSMRDLCFPVHAAVVPGFSGESLAEVRLSIGRCGVLAAASAGFTSPELTTDTLRTPVVEPLTNGDAGAPFELADPGENLPPGSTVKVLWTALHVSRTGQADRRPHTRS